MVKVKSSQVKNDARMAIDNGTVRQALEHSWLAPKVVEQIMEWTKIGMEVQ